MQPCEYVRHYVDETDDSYEMEQRRLDYKKQLNENIQEEGALISDFIQCVMNVNDTHYDDNQLADLSHNFKILFLYSYP